MASMTPPTPAASPTPPDEPTPPGPPRRKPSLLDNLTSRAMVLASATSILPSLDVSFRPRPPSVEPMGSRQRRMSSEVDATRANGLSHYDRSDISSAVVSTNDKFASIARLVATMHPHGLEPKAKKANHDAIVQHFQLRRMSGETARASYERADDDGEAEEYASEGSQTGKLERTPTEGSLSQIFTRRRQLQMRNKPRRVRDSVGDLRNLRRDLNVEVANRGAVCRRLIKWRQRVGRYLQIAALSCVLPFPPTGAFVRLRGALVFCAMMAQLFFVPLATVYFPHGTPATSALAVTFDLVFLLDILARFNTAYYDDKANKLEYSRTQIARRYVRLRGVWWLLVDVVACVPIDCLLLLAGRRPTHSSGKPSGVLAGVIPRALVRLLQWHSLLPATISGVARMLRAADKCSVRLLVQRHTITLQVVRILVVLVLATHYLACLWRVALTAVSHPVPTFDSAESPWRLYQADLVTSTQLLVGHLPITVGSELDESAFRIFATLFGGLVMALVTGLVALLLLNGSSNSARYQRKLASVLASMDKLQLPNQLRRRVHQYYDHLWTEHAAIETSEITALTSALSPSLALEVNLFKHIDLVVGVCFWRNCSADFITQIMLSLQTTTYLPEDYIMRQGEIGDVLFMINRGICELRAKPNDEDAAAAMHVPRAKRRLAAGDAFGELALLMNYRRTATVRALTFVEMCVLGRGAFQKILARYRDDRREVLREILLSCIEKKSKHVVPFPYEELVAAVVAKEKEPRRTPVTTWEAAEILVDLISASDCTDDSIQFGFRDFDFLAQHRLMPVAPRQPNGSLGAPKPGPPPPPPPPPPPLQSGQSEEEIASRLQSIEQWQQQTTERLVGLERGMHTMMAELARLTQTFAPISSARLDSSHDLHNIGDRNSS